MQPRQARVEQLEAIQQRIDDTHGHIGGQPQEHLVAIEIRKEGRPRGEQPALSIEQSLSRQVDLEAIDAPSVISGFKLNLAVAQPRDIGFEVANVDEVLQQAEETVGLRRARATGEAAPGRSRLPDAADAAEAAVADAGEALQAGLPGEATQASGSLRQLPSVVEVDVEALAVALKGPNVREQRALRQREAFENQRPAPQSQQWLHEAEAADRQRVLLVRPRELPHKRVEDFRGELSAAGQKAIGAQGVGGRQNARSERRAGRRRAQHLEVLALIEIVPTLRAKELHVEPEPLEGHVESRQIQLLEVGLVIARMDIAELDRAAHVELEHPLLVHRQELFPTRVGHERRVAVAVPARVAILAVDAVHQLVGGHVVNRHRWTIDVCRIEEARIGARVDCVVQQFPARVA